MKFAHEFEAALHREGFPDQWVASAIPYGQLKKTIKKVEGELRRIGLDAETLRQLVAANDGDVTPERNANGESVAFQYNFTDNPKAVIPKLTFFVHFQNGIATDATLSPATRNYLEGLAAQRRQPLSPSNTENSPTSKEKLGICLHSNDEVELDTGLKSIIKDNYQIKRIEVPLTSDTKFFDSLQCFVSTLDALQAQEQKEMSDETLELSQQVAKIASPSKTTKSDLTRWREIFDIYLQAGIFFSTTELDRGARTSTVALKQMQWFQDEVKKREIPKSFKLPASRNALHRFMKINLTLLNNLKFQEMNQLAIYKILKKFDKRTALGAKETFPKLISSQTQLIMSESMAKSVCAGVSKEIIKLVPQLDDYLCPICFSIAFKPVRLTCKHVFCIRCMITMQKEKKKFCPLCRDDVVMHADSDNLDQDLIAFLKKYFPKETQAKQRENEIAAGIDLYGPGYVDTKCIVM